MINKRYILFFLCLTLMTACGSGNFKAPSAPSSPATSTAHDITLKLSTSGALATNLSAVRIKILLPSGVTALLETDGSVSSSSIVALPSMVILSPAYIPASGTNKASIDLAVASSLKTGFGAVEYATIKLTAASGINPTSKDFAISEFNPSDITGKSISGLTPHVEL